MRVSREWLKPSRRHGWKAGWGYWANGISRDGYRVCGFGDTPRQAINDLVLQRPAWSGSR
jgi:hypothetical protein